MKRPLILLLTLIVGARASIEDRARAEGIARLHRGSYAVPSLGGLRVSYLQAGAEGGRLVIFVHGSPGSAEAWSDYLLKVPPGFEYVAVDRFGYGGSQAGVPEPSLARQAAAIAPLLARSRKAIVIGHSLGGPVVAELAAEHPHAISTLVILAGSLDPAMEKIRWYNRVADWPVVRAILPAEWTTSNRELRQLGGELQKLGPKLELIRADVIIVHGTRDRLVPVENVAYMRPRFEGARSVRTILLQGQDHFLPWTEKPLIDRLIAEARA